MKRILIIAAACLFTGCLVGANMPAGKVFKSFKYKEDWNEGVPKDWGRLVNAGTFQDGSSVMFFEAADGTIRRVGGKFMGANAEIQFSTHVVCIPRP